MNELRIFIDPGWPHLHADAVWYLCDGAGRVLGYGRSEPRGWPGVKHPKDEPAEGNEKLASQAASLILTGGQVASHRVRLPRGAAGRRPEVIAAALEDSLLIDPAECVLLPGLTDDEGYTPVAVADRKRLRGILSLFRDMGLELRSVWSDGQLLPERNGQRMARLEGSLLVLPMGKAGFTGLDLLPGQAPGPVLASLLTEGLPVLVAQGSDGTCLEEILPVPVAPEREEAGRFPLVPPPSGGFLVEEFAPPAERLAALRPFLPALRLAAGVALVMGTLVLAEWAWLAAQSRQLRQMEREAFHDAFPQAALVDANLQMQRQLDERRHRVGQIGTGDLLVMLDQLTGSEGLVWQSFDYGGGRLEARLTLREEGLPGLEGRLKAAGYRSVLKDRQAQGDGKVQVEIGLMQGGL